MTCVNRKPIDRTLKFGDVICFRDCSMKFLVLGQADAPFEATLRHGRSTPMTVALRVGTYLIAALDCDFWRNGQLGILDSLRNWHVVDR